jgi:transcriptional regulator with XRE-family HTH domain
MHISGKAIFDRIEDLAKRAGKNKRRADAARYANIAESTLIGWQKGSCPRVDLLDLIAEFYDVPLEYLVYGKKTDEKKNYQVKR